MDHYLHGRKFHALHLTKCHFLALPSGQKSRPGETEVALLLVCVAWSALVPIDNFVAARLQAFRARELSIHEDTHPMNIDGGAAHLDLKGRDRPALRELLAEGIALLYGL